MNKNEQNRKYKVVANFQAFELLVLETLDWDLNAVTPVLWRDLILEVCKKNFDVLSRRGPISDNLNSFEFK